MSELGSTRRIGFEGEPASETMQNLLLRLYWIYCGLAQAAAPRQGDLTCLPTRGRSWTCHRADDGRGCWIDRRSPRLPSRTGWLGRRDSGPPTRRSLLRGARIVLRLHTPGSSS
eukprot:scaffold31_cov263-Pinguiococcus_pyrenoidosus.AAC.47